MVLNLISGTAFVMYEVNERKYFLEIIKNLIFRRYYHEKQISNWDLNDTNFSFSN